jgi:hypothetical protein
VKYLIPLFIEKIKKLESCGFMDWMGTMVLNNKNGQPPKPRVYPMLTEDMFP